MPTALSELTSRSLDDLYLEFGPPDTDGMGLRAPGSAVFDQWWREHNAAIKPLFCASADPDGKYKDERDVVETAMLAGIETSVVALGALLVSAGIPLIGPAVVVATVVIKLVWKQSWSEVCEKWPTGVPVPTPA